MRSNFQELDIYLCNWMTRYWFILVYQVSRTCSQGDTSNQVKTTTRVYSVINLILPNSKQLLWHFFTNKQVDVLGDFNLEFWYILLFEVRFWIFRISFFAQNGDNSKGYPLENLKSHHLWFEKCFLITKCIKISVIKIISKLT